MGALSLLTQHWRAAIAGVMLLGLAIVIGVLYLERNAARQQIATLTAQNQTLTLAVQSQNAAVARIKAESQAKAAAAAKALSEAQQAAKTRQQIITKIVQAPAPKDECTGTLKLIQDYRHAG